MSRYTSTLSLVLFVLSAGIACATKDALAGDARVSEVLRRETCVRRVGVLAGPALAAGPAPQEGEREAWRE